MFRLAASRQAMLAVAAFLPVLGGCSYTVTRLGDDCAAPGGWCPDARRVADKSWQYAQLAQNTYWEEAETSDDYDDLPFVLPGELKERFASANDAYGFAYSVFDRFEDDRLVEVVLVYRGTEGIRDWWNGTLLGRQAPRGLGIYRRVRADLDAAGYAEVPLTLAGHSLGGRIADHVMKKIVREDGQLPETLSSYLFNPNAGGQELRNGVGGKGPVRIAVSETGDVAGWVRAMANDPGWDGYTIDCQSTIDPVASHLMRRLADCLTWVAAIDSAEAQDSARRNELQPPPSQRNRERSDQPDADD